MYERGSHGIHILGELLEIALNGEALWLFADEKKRARGGGARELRESALGAARIRACADSAHRHTRERERIQQQKHSIAPRIVSSTERALAHNLYQRS